MWSSVLSIVLVLISCYFAVRLKWKKHYKFSAQLDGPKDYPLIGSAHLFVGKTSHERFDILFQLCKKLKDKPIKAWLGPVLVFATINPDDLKVIYNSANCLYRSFIISYLNLDLGLLGSNPETWKIHRKLLNPSLSMQIIKSYASVFNDKAKIMCEKLDSHLGQGQFNIYTYTNRCTMDMINTTTLGKNFDLQNKTIECDKTIESGDIYKEMITDRAFTVWDHVKFIYTLSGKQAKFSKAQKETFRYSREIFTKKKQELSQKDYQLKESDIYDENYIKKPKIFIDLVFELSKQYPGIFTDQAILDEIDTIFVAGFDTTALALAHVVLLLAMHPEIQDRVAEEVRSLFNESDGIDDFELISKLDYLDMVIKESLRHLPVVPVSPRVTAADVPLASSDLVIPSNVLILVPVVYIHKDPVHWGPEAEKFNPDNFLKENVQKRHPYSFIPFGHGPRNCIGTKYAMISMKIVLANLLRRYKFRTTYTMETISLKLDIILKLNHEHLVSIELR